MPGSRLLYHSPSTDRAFSLTLLLATDSQQSVLGELHRDGLNHLAYNAYGVQSGPLAARAHLGFNGQLREGDGWYHLGNGHRVYNPALMRFYSPDRLSPFGKGGLNSYVYCVGDPINFTDPTGQSIEVPDWLQPVLTIALHIGIISATVVTAILNPPSGLARWAARTTLFGSTTAITGSVMQLAGEKDIGRVLSAAGTGISTLAVLTRAGLGSQNLVRQENPGSKVGVGLRNLFGVNKTPSKIVKAQLPARRPSGEIRSGSAGGEQHIQMDLLNGRSSLLNSSQTEIRTGRRHTL